MCDRPLPGLHPEVRLRLISADLGVDINIERCLCLNKSLNNGPQNRGNFACPLGMMVYVDVKQKFQPQSSIEGEASDGAEVETQLTHGGNNDVSHGSIGSEVGASPRDSVEGNAFD